MNMKNWTGAAAIVIATAGAAAAQVPGGDVEQMRGRQRVSTMEGVLERAVQYGADNLLRQVDTVLPGAIMLTGPPQARGFRLEGYGVVFYVQVPGVHMSVAWPLRALINDTRTAGALLEELRVRVAQVSPREREGLEQILRQLERTLPAAPPVAARSGGATVSAASLGSNAAAAPPPPVAPVDPDVLDDPQQAWTREVKTALVEAMLTHSAPLDLPADEWLTIAAQDSAPRDPLVPGGTADFSTVVLRVKGSDLSELHARRITFEEASKRVEVREY